MRVDSNGNIFNDDQARPVGRVRDGGIYDENGKLTGRYQGGKIYDLDGPWGGKVAGTYENGKIYDQNGSWGGNVIGYYSGDAFKEVSGCDPYRPPSDACPPTPTVEDRPPAPPPQQDRAPAAYVQNTTPRPPVWPQSGQGRGLSFLMSQCRYCGAPARVKHYTLLLVLTPVALLFYGFVVSVVVDFALTRQNDANIMIVLFASITTISIFLIPGLVILYFLRRPKGACDACSWRMN